MEKEQINEGGALEASVWDDLGASAGMLRQIACRPPAGVPSLQGETPEELMTECDAFSISAEGEMRPCIYLGLMNSGEPCVRYWCHEKIQPATPRSWVLLCLTPALSTGALNSEPPATPANATATRPKVGCHGATRAGGMLPGCPEPTRFPVW